MICEKTDSAASGKSFIEGRLPQYLARRHSEAFTIAAHLRKSEFDAVQLFGHRLKGSAAIYGLNDLSTIGCNLEDAARRASPDEISTLIDSLFAFLEQKHE